MFNRFEIDMIIGNGLLARSFINFDSEDFLIFVSGVSNSMETQASEFLREEILLRENIENHQNKTMIYFSTCSIYDSSKSRSPYVLHKLNMENIVIANCSKYLIYRVGNVIGNGGNSKTLFNFLVNKVREREQFTLFKNAKRPLIDVDDIALYFENSKHKIINKIVDISYPFQYSLLEIVNQIEKYFSIRANYIEVEDGDVYDIEFSDDVLIFFKNKTPEHYLSDMINKYAN